MARCARGSVKNEILKIQYLVRAPVLVVKVAKSLCQLRKVYIFANNFRGVSGVVDKIVCKVSRKVEKQERMFLGLGKE